MEIKEFIERIKNEGYDVTHSSAGKLSVVERIVISENEHHVALHPQIIQKASYEEILEHIRYEIKKLKSKQLS